MTILLFGATGNAGGAVLKACLADPGVTEVRAVTRRPPAAAHPKLRVVLHQDYRPRDAARGTSAAEGTGVRKCRHPRSC